MIPRLKSKFFIMLSFIAGIVFGGFFMFFLVRLNFVGNFSSKVFISSCHREENEIGNNSNTNVGKISEKENVEDNERTKKEFLCTGGMPTDIEIEILEEISEMMIRPYVNPKIHRSPPGIGDFHKIMKKLTPYPKIPGSIKVALAELLFKHQIDYVSDIDSCINNEWPAFRHDTKRRSDIVWYLFIPATWLCETSYRFGSVGDGGYFLCNPHLLTEEKLGRKARLYTGGVNDDITFENHFVWMLDGEVFMFDPTVSKQELINGGELISPYDANIHFRDWAMGPTKKFPKKISKSVKEISDHFEHKHVDILKVDTEGGEYRTFEQLFSNEVHILRELDIKQIVFEIHCIPVWGDKKGDKCRYRKDVLFKFLKPLYDNGYLMFMFEPFTVYGTLMQYMFIHKSSIV